MIAHVRHLVVCVLLLLFPHPAWPLVDGALLVSKRRSPAPDDLLTFVRPLCRPVGDPKPRGLQGSTGFVVGVVRSLRTMEATPTPPGNHGLSC